MARVILEKPESRRPAMRSPRARKGLAMKYVLTVLFLLTLAGPVAAEEIITPL